VVDPLNVDDVDISHLRLVELTRLADQAKPFYDWVTAQFQAVLSVEATLEQMLNTATKQQLEQGLLQCYNASQASDLPLLFDGVG
jgi:hypothetical protein